MKKTIDEQLFEQVMRAPRSVRRKTFEFPFPRPFFVRERLLVIADSYDGGVRQKTLVDELDISPAAVSELVTKLEKDKYVSREVDPDDKRATLISASSSRKNEAAGSFLGMLRDAFEQAMTADSDKVFYELPDDIASDVVGHFVDDPEYDQYEASVLKKLADDVKIAIRGGKVHMTVRNAF